MILIFVTLIFLVGFFATEATVFHIHEEKIRQQIAGWSRQKSKARQWLFKEKRTREFIKTVPDMLDLMVLGIEGGWPLEKSLAAATRELPLGTAKQDWEKVLTALEFGRPLKEALMSLVQQYPHPLMMSFRSYLVHSQKSGIPLSALLAPLAHEARESQYMEFEHQAQLLPTKLLFPLVFFIFPTLFLILFGSLYLQLRQNGGLF